MDDAALTKGRCIVVALGILLLVLEICGIVLTKEIPFVRIVLDAVLFALVYLGYNWARIAAAVIFALGSLLGIVLVALFAAGTNPVFSSLPVIFLFFSIAVAAYCIVAMFIFADAKTVKALSKKRGARKSDGVVVLQAESQHK